MYLQAEDEVITHKHLSFINIDISSVGTRPGNIPICCRALKETFVELPSSNTENLKVNYYYQNSLTIC